MHLVWFLSFQPWVSLFWNATTLLCILIVHFFLCWLIFHYRNISQLLYSFIYKHLSCFQFGAIINQSALTFAYKPLWGHTLQSSWTIPSSVFPGLYGRCGFKFLKKLLKVFVTRLHQFTSQPQCIRVSVPPHLNQQLVEIFSAVVSNCNFNLHFLNYYWWLVMLSILSQTYLLFLSLPLIKCLLKSFVQYFLRCLSYYCKLYMFFRCLHTRSLLDTCFQRFSMVNI